MILLRLFCTIILFVNSIHLFAQQRVSTPNLVHFVSKSSIISNPVGWSYSDWDKKWCGHIGLCLDNYSKNDIKPLPLSIDDLSGAGNRGILSLQFEKISVRNQIYYLLHHIYWDGEYKYPHIERGWFTYKSCDVYIFTANEYNKLFDLSTGINVVKVFDETGTSYPNTAKARNYLNSNYNRIFEDSVSGNIGTNPKIAYYTPHYFYVKLEDDGQTVRFQLPNNKELKDVTEKKLVGILDRHEWVDFDKEYFELPLSKWIQLQIK